MIAHARPLALLAAATGLLAACGSGAGGGSDDAQKQAQDRLAQISAATHPSATSTAAKGPTIDPTSVDVCGLLSAADANSVAHAEQLDGFQTPTEVYSLTATKQTESGGLACHVLIKAPAGSDGEGSATFHVRSATGFAVPPDGQPISGLGDEAYDTGTDPVVRVGTVTISADDNSFADSFTVALLRKMVPRIK